MRLARIGLGSYGRRYELTVMLTPAWALAAAAVAEKVCVLTGHIMCTPREWMFRIGWSDDDGGGLSLGGLLYDLGQWSMCVDARHTRHEYVQPLTLREVERHFPDARMPEYEDDLEEPWSTTIQSINVPTVTSSTMAGQIRYKAG